MQQTQITDKKIYSVAELNRQARNLVESGFGQLWVEGEVSNFIRAGSGHWYFSLKDEQAQVRCAMFSGRNRTLGFQPKDGMHVILRGKASIYEGRGEFQLIAENIMPAGEGLLQQRFEALKQKLDAEGLFSSDHKRPIPSMPRHLGVITSTTGAAIHDILTVLRRRFPALPITIIPTMVQGTAAAQQIVKAIELANTPALDADAFDVLIVGRGGGSLEDLWCFNEEAVARAIFASKVPIISAVGHEIDFTIADFVADLRAPTPSAAAELVVPDQDEWQRNLAGYAQYFTDTLKRQLVQRQAQLTSLQKRLRHPGRQLQDHAQRLDYIETRLAHAITSGLKLRAAKLAHIVAELRQHLPSHQIKRFVLQNQQLEHRLHRSMKQTLLQHQNRLQSKAQELNAFNPLETLQRGYAIVLNQNQQVVRTATQVAVGDRVTARLGAGKLHCLVDGIEK